MSEMSGTDVLIRVLDGTVWRTVASQRNASREETNEEVDFSSKESRAGKWGYGRYGSTMNLEALYVPTNEAFQMLRDARRDGDKIKVRIQEDQTETEEADAVITNMTEEFPDQEAATITMDLRIDGEWQAVST